MKVGVVYVGVVSTRMCMEAFKKSYPRLQEKALGH